MDARTRIPASAALTGFLVAAAWLVAWELYVVRYDCGTGTIGDCLGPASHMILFGLPAAYVAWSLLLWAAGVSLPWLVALVATVLAGAVLAAAGAALDASTESAAPGLPWWAGVLAVAAVVAGTGAVCTRLVLVLRSRSRRNGSERLQP